MGVTGYYKDMLELWFARRDFPIMNFIVLLVSVEMELILQSTASSSFSSLRNPPCNNVASVWAAPHRGGVVDV
jgi:hypothetical protein